MKDLEQVVFTTSEIMSAHENITIIYYDDDGTWQALSETSNLDSPKIISLKNLFEIDPELKDVLKLMEKGEKAIKKDSEWTILTDD